MATKSPVRIMDASGKWGSQATFEELGLVLKGQSFQEKQRNMGPTLSGSAPPSMEGMRGLITKDFTPVELRSGIAVAVKKLKPKGFQGHTEWLSEITYLGQLDHPNLVNHIGFCSKAENWLVVYKFMSQSSLENHLFRCMFGGCCSRAVFLACFTNKVVTLGDGGGSSGGETLALRMPVVGVSRILRKEQEMWESTDKSLQDAFQDLNALMTKAKDVLMLAEKMQQKLLSGSSSQSNVTNDEEMGSKEEMQDWLLSVGIVSPVTKESARALYHQELSRQDRRLADFVKIPLERAGGIMNLIDIYCLFNRARGTELISPDDLPRACSIWEKFNGPVILKKFESGVMVIHNKSHS